MEEVTARNADTGEAVDVQRPGHTGTVLTGGGAVNAGAAASTVNPKNPLNEETIRVRVNNGVEFFFQGDLVKEGDEFDMPISMARAAAQYISQIGKDGKLQAVPGENQAVGNIPRANLAGMARHERIGALEAELTALDARKADVQKRLEHEKTQADAEKKAAALNKPPALAPGVQGGHGNVAQPPRPGEPGGGIKT